MRARRLLRRRASRSRTRSPGLPFPGNVIPASRLDPAAQNIMNFFYPLPNAGTLSNGYGRYRQFVPEHAQARARRPADRPRAEHERLALPPRQLPAPQPASIIFEAGNALTNMPILDSQLDTAAVIGGWTKIFSTTVVNELRVGYNYDNSKRQSNYVARGRRRASSGSRRRRASSGPASSASRPSTSPARTAATNIAGRARNVDRTVTQNAFSISNATTFVLGSHSLRAGGLWNRNTRVDGFGIGVNVPRLVPVQRRGADRATLSPTSCSATSRTARATSTPPAARWTGHSDDFARLRPGRLAGQQEPDRVPRPALRARRHVAREERHPRELRGRRRRPPRRPERTRWRAKLPPGLQALGRTLIASQIAATRTRSSTPTRTTSARASASPGGRPATTGRSCGAASASSTRPSPCRACATCLATNEFRYYQDYRGGTPRSTPSRRGRPSSTRPRSATRASTRTSRARTSTSTT